MPSVYISIYNHTFHSIVHPTLKSGYIGMDIGANFLVSDHGFRIATEKMCVLPRMFLWHGTGWYYNGLNQVGLVLVLTARLNKNGKTKEKNANMGSGGAQIRVWRAGQRLWRNFRR